MTLSTSNNTASYTGDNSTVAFAFPYLFYENSHLQVRIDGVLQTSGFTITGAENPDGGTVTFSTAPTNGAAVTIQRIVPYTQETDLENFDGNPADVTEKQFDLLAMADQQIAEQADRVITSPLGVTLASNEISGTINSTPRVITITTDGPAASSVSDLSTDIDTVFTGLANNDVLQYNGSDWVNESFLDFQNSLGLKQNNYAGTTAPTVNEDSDDGYSVGSQWYDGTNDNMYHCLDATVGAAVWVQGDVVAADLGGMAVLEIASQAEAEAGTSSTKGMTPQRTAQAIAALGSGGTEIAEVATTSGATIEIATGLSGVKQVTININDTSINANTAIMGIQLGDSTSYKTSGYSGGTGQIGTGAAANSSQFSLSRVAIGVSEVLVGSVVLTKCGDTDKWNITGTVSNDDGVNTVAYTQYGSITLSGELTRIRMSLDIASGTPEYDAGAVSGVYM